MTYFPWLALQDTGAPTICIYPDISCTDRVKNLCKRGEKTILVKKSGVEVDPNKAKHYDKVEIMDPKVESYYVLYTKPVRVGEIE